MSIQGLSIVGSIIDHYLEVEQLEDEAATSSALPRQSQVPVSSFAQRHPEQPPKSRSLSFRVPLETLPTQPVPLFRPGELTSSTPPFEYYAASDIRHPESDSIHSPPYGFTWEQTEQVLVRFMLDFVPSFPFISTPTMTPFEMLQERPFLLRAILLVATPLPESRQQVIRKQVLQYLADHLLVREERSLDLLQGLLVCLMWADFDAHRDRQMTHLTYLAMGYAYNLGMAKIPLSVVEQVEQARGTSTTQEMRAAELLREVHSLEEQRVYLGCFYIMALNSVRWGRTNSLRSRYVSVLCDGFAWPASDPGDYVAGKTIRLLQTALSMSDFTAHSRDPVLDQNFQDSGRSQVQSTQRELTRIFESVPHAHPQFQTFRRHYSFLSLCLCKPWIGVGNGERSLSSCLEAITTFFESLLKECLDSSSLLQNSLALEQLHCVTALTLRVLMVDRPGGDPGAARSALDFPALADAVMSRVTDYLDAARARVHRFVQQTGLELTTDELAEGSKRLSGILARMQRAKNFYESRVADPGRGKEKHMDVAAALSSEHQLLELIDDGDDDEDLWASSSAMLV